MKKCILFKNLSDEDVKSLLEIAKQEIYNKDDVIFKRGEIGDSFFLILEGSVRVSVILEDIGEEILAMLKKGAHFGEMSLIDKGQRSASIIAHEDSKLLKISKEPYDKLLKSNQNMELIILRNMVKAFTSRIRDTNQSLAFLRFTLRKD